MNTLAIKARCAPESRKARAVLTMAGDARLVGIPPVPPSRARGNNRVVQLPVWKAEA